MPSLGDISEFVTALVAVAGFWLTWRKIHAVQQDVKTVEQGMNGMKTELVAATRSGALAEGKAKGRAEEKAERK